MTNFEIDSIQKNLEAFLKDVGLDDFIILVNWICYTGLDKPLTKYPKLPKAFILEFVGETEYAALHWDETHHQQYFLKSDGSTRDIYQHMRIALMQEPYPSATRY